MPLYMKDEKLGSKRKDARNLTNLQTLYILMAPNNYEEHSHQEIPGSNPGQVSALTCWPNGKAPDYGASRIFLP